MSRKLIWVILAFMIIVTMLLSIMPPPSGGA